jgi:MraZ protein
MRGSAPARIDDKGRLKVPTLFRRDIQDHRGPDVFVTSIRGDCVRIYPMSVWLEIERKLSAMPSNHPSRVRFLAAVNYYGQPSELDVQGRIVIPPQLRSSASIVGDVRVFGHIDYLEVWNEELFVKKLHADPLTDEDALRLAEFGI